MAENASGKGKLWPSFFQAWREMIAHPVKFLRSPPFFWIWLVCECAAPRTVDWRWLKAGCH
jgi:hypothetical protein